jgi:hypothetical protein
VLPVDERSVKSRSGCCKVCKTESENLLLLPNDDMDARRNDAEALLLLLLLSTTNLASFLNEFSFRILFPVEYWRLLHGMRGAGERVRGAVKGGVMWLVRTTYWRDFEAMTE